MNVKIVKAINLKTLEENLECKGRIIDLLKSRIWLYQRAILTNADETDYIVTKGTVEIITMIDDSKFTMQTTDEIYEFIYIKEEGI